MFFPGYVLIKMNLNANTKYIIENTPGVLSFVGPKGESPVPLRDDEIRRIFGEVERKEGIEIVETPYKKGDAIKVVQGIHAINVLKSVQCITVKQGPFISQAMDKVNV